MVFAEYMYDLFDTINYFIWGLYMHFYGLIFSLYISDNGTLTQ